MIIAIDGPAASGKSTIARMVAKELGFDYIDTGAMYRALTWLVLREKVDISDKEVLVALSEKLDVRFKRENSKIKVMLGDKEVTKEVRSVKVDSYVSVVSKVSSVRRAMVKKQRALGKNKDVVVEGRDIGTVVFPGAELKIYLTATAEERSKRRRKDFLKKGHDLDLDLLEREIVLRDKIDSSRRVAPLSQAPDAFLIDTTKKSIDEVEKEITALYRKVVKNRS